MKSNRLANVLWVFPLAITALACPTRTISSDASDGSMGSGGRVDSGSDRGDESGAGGNTGTGGASGAGVVSGASGNGGASGVGGAAGNGGASGVTGAGGNGGVGGTGGTVRDGQPCSLAKDCASGTCTAFYVDVDGDGYGTGQAIGFCGTTPPVGYAAQSGDCCDSASNLAIAKLIHPGADFQTTSAGGVCNITWDYDCSGTVESSPQTVSCGQIYPACATTIVSFAESSCGTGEDMTCVCGGAGNGTSGSCFTTCGGHPTVTIGCR